MSEKLYSNDSFDIFKLDDDEEWTHIQILKRLHNHNIQCLFADIWFDNNIAYLIGVKDHEDKIARVLNIHKECIYYDPEHGLMILNLFQEKYLRGIL